MIGFCIPRSINKSLHGKACRTVFTSKEVYNYHYTFQILLVFPQVPSWKKCQILDALLALFGFSSNTDALVILYFNLFLFSRLFEISSISFRICFIFFFPRIFDFSTVRSLLCGGIQFTFLKTCSLTFCSPLPYSSSKIFGIFF